jgi:hypothetical protein
MNGQFQDEFLFRERRDMSDASRRWAGNPVAR